MGVGIMKHIGRVMARTLTVPLVELMNKCTVTVATVVLFVARFMYISGNGNNPPL
jgi:hypothetical protein